MNQLYSNINRNPDSKYISLSTILRGGIVFAIFMLGILFILQYLFALPFYADIWTYVVTSFICIVLYFFVTPGRKQFENSIKLGVCTFVLLIFLQRIFSLIVFPFTFSGLPLAPMYSLEELNRAILIFTGLLIIFWAGIKTASSLPLKFKALKPFLPEYTSIRTVFYVIAIVSLIITLFMGSILGWKMGKTWSSGWIVRLFPISMYSVMLMLLWSKYRGALPGRDKIFIASYFFLIFFWSLSQGSRSGLYGLGLMFFVGGIIAKGNMKFPKKRLIVVSIISILTGPVIWILGTSIRTDNEWKLTVNPTELLTVLPSISMRLGGSTDNYIKAINDWGDQGTIDEMLTLGTLVKVSVNAVLPGTIFEVPYDDTGNLWVNIIYNEPLRRRMYGETWSGFGFYYLLTGYGIILLVFFWAFFVTLILRFLMAQNTLFFSLITYYFYSVYIYSFFNKGMLDHTIRETMQNAAYITIFYLILILVTGAVSYRNSSGSGGYGRESVAS